MTEFFRAAFPGEAPTGWRRIRVEDALRVVSSPIEMRDNEIYRLVSVRRRHGGMFDRERLPGKRILTKDLSRAVVGAFVIAKRQVVHGATCVVPPEFQDAALASSYAQLVGTDRCDVRFFSWLAQLPAMTCAFYDASQGVVVEKLTLSLPTWLRTKVNLPPRSEQRRIAEVLDTIDGAIRKTEETIAKLKQVKQGLLHDLLTRGIDDRGELRDPDRYPEQFSDSPLGRIPKAWTQVQLKTALDAIIDYRGSTPPYSSEGVPVISQEDIQADGLRPTSKWVTKATADRWVHRGVLRPNDVVFRMERFIGEVVRVPSDQRYIVTRGVLALRPAPRFSSADYLFWHLFWRKRTNRWDGHSHGTTVPRMYKPDLLDEVIPFPPVAEQAAITGPLDALERRIASERRRVAKLALAKLGLMEDLLTGRVRVTALLEEAAE